MPTSPTQRSLRLLRDDGYTVAVVERWNSFAKIRQDMFGFIDLVAIRPGEIVGVQTTTRANMAARRAKIAAEPRAAAWLAAGGLIVLHGWMKEGRHWECARQRYEAVETTQICARWVDLYEA